MSFSQLSREDPERSPPGGPNKKPKPKCTQCRKDRRSCLPQPRKWPAKCDRCQEKNLLCSEPAWAPRFRSRATPDAATTRQAQPCAEDAPAASPRGQKRPPPDLSDSSDSPYSSLSEGPLDAAIAVIRNGASGDSEVQLSDLVDAVRMYELVATEHRNLDRLWSSASWTCQGESKRLDLLRSTGQQLQSCLIDSLEKWPSNHGVARNSAEMLLLNQLQRAILCPDVGVLETEYALPGYSLSFESNDRLMSSMENVLWNNPTISNVSFAAEMLFSKHWTSTADQSWPHVSRLLWNWWREDKGFIRMASTAKLLNLPEECQTISFWKSSAVVVPKKWSGGWDPYFFGLSLMGADELIANMKQHLWSPGGYRFMEQACENHSRDAFGQTVLHIAAAHGSSQVVSEVISRRPSFLKTQSNAGHTPLHIAASKGREEVCKLMLQSNDGQLGSQLQDRNGWTALWHATENGNSNVFRQFFALQGPEFGQVGRQTEHDGDTLLMIAESGTLLAQDIIDIMDLCDLSKKDRCGYTALHHLISSGSLCHVQLFLSSTNPGATRAIQDTGRDAEVSPLEFALDASDDIAVALLGSPGIVIEPTSPDFPNLLFYAILKRRTEAAKVLAQRRDIDIFAKHDGMTAEELAQDRGLDDLAYFLKNLMQLNAEERAGYHQAEEQSS